jgi:spore germination protein
MENSENNTRMTPAQFGLLTLVVGLGPQALIAFSTIGADADQLLWFSLLIGGFLNFGAACIMLKLCALYPQDTVVEIARKTLGKFGGFLLLAHFSLVLLTHLILAARVESNVIQLFLFDQTPSEVICLLFLGTTVYCAIQDWDTQLMVIQVFTLTELPLMVGLWLLCFLNFQPEHLLPLWPDKPLGLLRGAVNSYNVYSGYEIILVLYPLVTRGHTNLFKAVAWGMGLLSAIYVAGAAVLTGALTAATVKLLPYPAISALKGVSIPGTFVERLENFMLLSWLPLFLMSSLLLLYCLAETFRRQFGLTQHRTFVPLWLPVIFLAAKIIETPQNLALFSKLTLYTGLLFSFAVIPVLWLRVRKAGTRL